MRARSFALLCIFGAAVLVAGACTPPTTPTNWPPVAVIDASVTTGTPGLEVEFSALSSTDHGSIVSYEWDLGDGDTSTLDEFSHVYVAEGVYTVVLTVTDDQGLTDTETVDITVTPGNQPPTVAPAADVTSGLAPLTVNFTSNAADSDGTIASVEWDFGDGNTSTDADPTHVYAAVGTYAATVTATDDLGAVTSDSINITVNANQAPTAVAQADATSGKTPLTVNFDGSTSSDVDGTVVSHEWDFGDGNTASGATAQNTFTIEGSYTVTLTVTDDLGATDSTTLAISVADNVAPLADVQATPTSGHAPLEVFFGGNASSDSDGTIVSYSWDFGDGDSSADVAPAHTYATAGVYTAELTVTDDDGATGTDLVTINVGVPNVAPTAVADATPTSGPEDLVVSFDSSGSSDPDGSVTSVVWDYGDGDTSASPAPTHTYTDPGTYTVSLTVTDDDGATDTDSLTITVTPNQAPTASATATPLTAKVGTSVAFDGSGSSDADGTIVSYDWDFADGATSSAVSPDHVFNSTGTFGVSLTVTDDDGDSDTTSVTVSVVPNQAPTAAISANPQTGAYPLDVDFDSSGSNDPDGSIASVMWNFGDGTTSTAAAPTHTYTTDGTFTATLTVTDDDGASDTASVSINVVQDNDGDGFSPPTDCDDSEQDTYPGAPDPLDDDGTDSDCDGVDGIAGDTVFVDSSGGADSGACGLLGSPCATIGQGVANANAAGKGVVQVSSGSYGGFTLNGDVTVRGGYENDFDGRTGTTTVTGNGTGVLADGASAGATLADLTINSGSPVGAGASAYGVRATGSTLEIENSNIAAAAGNSGVAGTTPSGALTPGSNGANGGNGGQHSVPSGATGGGTGANAGGNGGSGEGNAGANGANGGAGGGGGCNNCTSNSNYSGGGAAGGAKGPNGSSGNTGSPGTANFADVYSPTNGSSGTGGGNGGGGGGGGGGGRACDGFWCAGQWTGGGAGGKGGGGGQGGAGGTVGTSGGGSFAVYSNSSTVSIDADTTLSTADGGNGGNGGNGQAGAPGGSGGKGGNGAKADNVTGSPGSGGSGGAPNANGASGGNGAAGTCCNASSGGGGGGGGGGNGGTGGNGGGGAGGPSIAMLSTGTGSITFAGDLGTQVTIGSGGSGGNNASSGQATKLLDVA